MRNITKYVAKNLKATKRYFFSSLKKENFIFIDNTKQTTEDIKEKNVKAIIAAISAPNIGNPHRI